MTDLIAEFCAFHHAYHNISAGRVDAQTRLLRRLESSLAGREIASLSSQDLEAFLVAQDVAPGTILKYLKMIRPFASWMWKNGHITAERLMQLRDVKAPRGAGWSPPKPYTRAQIAAFWRAFDEAFPWTADEDPYDRTAKRGEYWVRRWQESPDDFEWRHVRPYAARLQAEAIVALALFGGLRRIEIFNLELDGFHYENAYVRVVGAAKNPGSDPMVRAVGWTPEMKAAVANWIEFRAQVLKPYHTRPWLALWAEHYNEPMSLSAFAHLLGGVGEGYSLHRMRHTFATERLRAGMPIEKLRVALGHRTIAMTLQYAQIGEEDVVLATERTNDDFAAAVGRGE